MRRAVATVTLAVALAVGGVASCRHMAASTMTGTQRGGLEWARTYSGLQPHGNAAAAVAVSPSGSAVYVTGESDGTGSLAHGIEDYATVAYSAATGADLWTSRYNGPGHGGDYGYALAVSPLGTTVFVTGSSDGGRATSSDYATIAYNAATGARRWVSRYNGPASRHDEAHSIAVSPNGALLFVTGQSAGTSATGGNAPDYATVAYNATTGVQMWVSRYNGPANGADDGTSVAVSPDGKTVFVTGTSDIPGEQVPSVVTTVAYRAANGAPLWVRADRKAAADQPPKLAVSPGGQTVFVIAADTAVAYSAATGKRLWTGILPGSAYSVAVGPAGSMVYVTGCAVGGTRTGTEYVTAAFDGATGARQWVSRYANTKVKYACAHAVAVSKSGDAVYVTGTSGQSSFGTIAYDARTGRQLWFSRYQHFGKDFVYAQAIAPSPVAGSVFVTGTDAKNAYVTLAYRG